jgi:LysM repeat protein
VPTPAGAKSGEERPSPPLTSTYVVEEKNIRSESQVYIVKSGDTLSKIIKESGLTKAEFYKLNSLSEKSFNPDKIQIGQQFIVKPAQVYYTVKRGDNLSKIAKSQSVTIKSIKEFNKLKSDTIYPNQVLRIK